MKKEEPIAELSIRLHQEKEGIQLEVINHVEQDDLITMMGCLFEQKENPLVKSSLAIMGVITQYYEKELNGDL